MNISTFLAELAKMAEAPFYTNIRWGRLIRVSTSPQSLFAGYQRCPLAAVATKLTGRNLTTQDWVRASQLLEMTPTDADRIMMAADGIDGHDPVLRANMLSALNKTDEAPGQ